MVETVPVFNFPKRIESALTTTSAEKPGLVDDLEEVDCSALVFDLVNKLTISSMFSTISGELANDSGSSENR